MKVSLNWLKQFTDIELDIDALVAKIGSQLGAVDEVIDYGARYKDIVVAEITAKQDHPNADKLAIYQANHGAGSVQVVSGDKNLSVGDKVAWIQPGAVVPSTFDKDPLTLDSRPLRGEDSHGMFGSAAELLINDNKDSVLVLDTLADAGATLADAYELDDYIIDIENKMFTHRPDCFGILGIAREVAGIGQVKFVSPEWYASTLSKLKKGKADLALEVTNDITDIVPRYMMVALAGVEIKDSPIIMQSYLSRLGLRPINNVVDITNYIMVLTGQPLHAFDYDKVKALDPAADRVKLVVRKPRPGEKLKLINGRQLEPRADAAMIASDSQLIAVGGVMGGANSEVDGATKNILLECATFDMYSIRRTSMAHGLFSDAVSRFNKGQSSQQNDGALNEAVAMVESLAGGQVASDLFDLGPELPNNPTLYLPVEFINQRLGLKLTASEMATLLRNVEFDVGTKDDTLSITAPFWRTDIAIAEDVVEEIGRLTGYDKLPLELPSRTVKPVGRNRELDFHARLRAVLSRAGANEALSYSFVHGDLLAKAGQDVAAAFRLSNALSPDLQYFRTSLTPSLLASVHGNIKAGVVAASDDNEFGLFEINKVYIKGLADPQESELPAEFTRLALVIAADDKTAARKYSGAAYYQAAAYLSHLLQALAVDFELNPLDRVALEPALAPLGQLFVSSRAAQVVAGGQVIGAIGEYNLAARQSLKLPLQTAGFELDIDRLQALSGQPPYRPRPRFPKTSQDMTLQIAPAVSYGQLHQALLASLADQPLYEVLPISIYQPPQATERNITFRIWLADYQRTLTTAEVNTRLDQVAATLHEQLGAVRI